MRNLIPIVFTLMALVHYLEIKRFYNFLDLKSRQLDANDLPLDRRITQPDPDAIDHQSPLIQNLCRTFELKENPKKKKARTQESLTYKGADGEAKKLEDPYAEKAKVIEVLYPSTEKVGTIGDVNPVKDFEAMLAERSSSVWVQKAIEEMEKYITALIENSPQGDYYQKGLECFVALSKAVLLNRFLTKLYERLGKVGDVAEFFQLLSSKSVWLISEEEASDSVVPEETARSFYLKAEASSQ